MGLFRRKKKRDTQSTSKPQDGNLDIGYGNVKYNTRQNDSGSIIPATSWLVGGNISDAFDLIRFLISLIYIIIKI